MSRFSFRRQPATEPEARDLVLPEPEAGAPAAESASEAVPSFIINAPDAAPAPPNPEAGRPSRRKRTENTPAAPSAKQ